MLDLQKDDLTEFFLRKTLYSFLEKLIQDAAANKRIFSIVLIDLDRFKKFNDKYGHPFGDEILKYMASIIRLSFMGSPSHFFRYGGDEFIVLLPEKDAKQAYMATVQYKYNMAHRPFLFNDNFFKITTSCGIANFPLDGQTIDQMIRKADEAMYYAKKHGRNKTILASKLKLHKIRGFLLFIVATCIIFQGLVMFSQYVIQKSQLSKHIKLIQDTANNYINRFLKHPATPTPTEPPRLDVVVLKNGTTLKGRILSESDTKIVFSLPLAEGSASISYPKTSVEKIMYAAEPAEPAPKK